MCNWQRVRTGSDTDAVADRNSPEQQVEIYQIQWS